MRDFLNLANRFRETAIVDDEFPLHRDRFDNALRNLTETIPKIVCLCGSTRFKKEFEQANKNETVAGNIVLSVGCFPHTDNGVSPENALGEEIKKNLDELHKRKIDLADEIFVLNVGGYIGESTRSEIDYAQNHCKVIRYLEAEQSLENARADDTIPPRAKSVAVS